ncbi:MAG: MFS transporter, partial [Anaerolineales bacterium]
MSRNKINNQLIYLFVSSFAILFVGMGLFPLLPIYFSKFGASQSMIGVFFGMIYLANAAGPMTIGWLADRVSHRSLFITVSLIGLPALILLGWATSLWQVILLTGIVWYTGGLCLALISIFTGMHTGIANRGRSFSLVSLSIPLGSLIGGATIAFLVSSYGYGLLFLVLGVVWSALPLLGWLFIADEPVSQLSEVSLQTEVNTPRLGSRYFLLLL